MSRGRTGRLKHTDDWGGPAWRSSVPLDPALTRAFWPRARGIGLKTLPTISGKRPASRRARAQWLKELREERLTQRLGEAGAWAMEQHRRMENATPEEQRRIFEEGL